MWNLELVHVLCSFCYRCLFYMWLCESNSLQRREVTGWCLAFDMDGSQSEVLDVLDDHWYWRWREPVSLFYLMTHLTHNSFLYMFISILYMFRAFNCSSSGDSIVSIRYLVYVALCRWSSAMQVWTGVQTCIPGGHLHRATYTRYRIDTIESPDDEHLNARNM